MSSIPANFLTRQELQSLIMRTGDLAANSHGELAINLRALLIAAANLEGQLSDMIESGDKAVAHYPEVFISDDWESEWIDSRCSLHTPRGLFSIAFGQQLLKKSNGKAPVTVIATGRYRVILGGRTHVTADRQSMRPLAEDYLATFEDVVSPDVRTKYLDRCFGKPDGDKEVTDAIQE